MWPLERLTVLRKTSLVLHASRHGVSAYAWAHGVDEPWSQRDFAPIPTSSTRNLTNLVDALRSLIQRQAQPLRSIRLLLDSCWVPVMCVSAGEAVLDAVRFDALARHSLESSYGPSWRGWLPHTPFKPGDHSALVFFFNPEHMDTFLSLSPCKWSVVSTVAWVWDVAWRKTPTSSHAIWHTALVEADRTLMLTFVGRQLQGCHPAMSQPHSLSHMRMLATLEQRRLGLSMDGSIPLRAFAMHPTQNMPKQSMREDALHWQALQVVEEAGA